MRVNVNITIELDHGDWHETFGKGRTRREVANEVRQDVIEYVYQQNETRGIPVTVTHNH